jgi:hypothetical protein
MRRTNGDRAIGVAGIIDAQRQTSGDRATRDCVLVSIARVSRRDNDHNARTNHAIDHVAQRALSAGKPFGVEVIADAQIHTVDLQVFSVPVDAIDFLERGDEIAHLPVPFLVEHLHAHDRAFRSDATNVRQRDDVVHHVARFVLMPRDRGDGMRLLTGRDIRCVQLAGNDARHVRSMTEFVDERALGFTGANGEIAMTQRRVELQRVVLSKMRMISLHAGVEHRPHHFASTRRE